MGHSPVQEIEPDASDFSPHGGFIFDSGAHFRYHGCLYAQIQLVDQFFLGLEIMKQRSSADAGLFGDERCRSPVEPLFR